MGSLLATLDGKLAKCPDVSSPILVCIYLPLVQAVGHNTKPWATHSYAILVVACKTPKFKIIPKIYFT
jgi:hypothetical protein